MIGLRPVTGRDLIHHHTRPQAFLYDPRLYLIRPLPMYLSSARPRRDNLQRSLHGETPCHFSMKTRSQMRRQWTTWGWNSSCFYAGEGLLFRKRATSSRRSMIFGIARR